MSDRLGVPVANFTPPPVPKGEGLQGRYAELAMLSADRHAGDLHQAFFASEAIWDYMPYGPFHSAAAYHR